MSRYSPEALSEMADTVIKADERQDPRALLLYMTISGITGLDPMIIKERIRRLRK